MNVFPDRLHFLNVVSIVLCLALVVAGCTPAATDPGPAATTPAPTLIPIKVGLQPFMGYAPLFIAQEEGYFEKYGLSAEFVELKSSVEAVPLLMQGQIDLTPVAVNPGFFNAVAKGGRARGVLGGSQWASAGCTSTGILARQADLEKYRDIAAWKGATLATDPVGLVGMPGYLLDRILGQQGLGLADIQTAKLPSASMAEALQAGSIDLVQATEPWITRIAGQADAAVIVPAQEIIPNGQLSFIAFSPRLIDNPDLGQRAARAYLDGVRQYIHGDRARNTQILAKYTQIDPALLQQLCWSAIPEDGSANLPGVMDFQAWAVQQGNQDRIVEPAEFWDSQFVAAIQK